MKRFYGVAILVLATLSIFTVGALAKDNDEWYREKYRDWLYKLEFSSSLVSGNNMQAMAKEQYPIITSLLLDIDTTIPPKQYAQQHQQLSNAVSMYKSALFAYSEGRFQQGNNYMSLATYLLEGLK